MGNSSSNTRPDRYYDSTCTFIDSEEYSTTNLYKSDALYHKKSKFGYNIKHLKSYTQNSKDINDALNHDDISVNKTLIRELDKCVVSIRHDIFEVFQQIWNSHNLFGQTKLKKIWDKALSGNFVALFRGARLNKGDYEFLQACYNQGKRLRNKSFLSCSLLPNVAVSFQDLYNQGGYKILFTVYVHKSDTRSYAYVKEFSEFPEEEEVMVRPYRCFTITDIHHSTTEGCTYVSLISDPPY